MSANGIARVKKILKNINKTKPMLADQGSVIEKYGTTLK